MDELAPITSRKQTDHLSIIQYIEGESERERARGRETPNAEPYLAEW